MSRREGAPTGGRLSRADIIAVLMPKISAVLIAQNEEDRIETALQSLAFCDMPPKRPCQPGPGFTGPGGGGSGGPG